MTEKPRPAEQEVVAQEAAIKDIPTGAENLKPERTSLMNFMRNHPGLHNAMLILAGVSATLGGMRTSRADTVIIGGDKAASEASVGKTKPDAPGSRADVYTKFYKESEMAGRDDVISTVRDKALYKLKGEDKIQRVLDIGGGLQYLQVKGEGGNITEEDEAGLRDLIAQAKRFCLDNKVPLGKLFDLGFAGKLDVDPRKVPPAPLEPKPAGPAGDAPSEKDKAELDKIIGSVGKDHAKRKAPKDEGRARIEDVYPGELHHVDDPENPLK